MLVIRLQRTGRSGHAQFRVVVQDSRFSPTSGRVVAYVGSYNPHNKAAKLDVEKISGYLKNGAQPSPRVAKLLKAQKVDLPKWVEEPGEKQRKVRFPEKRRSTAPEQPAEAEVPAEGASEEAQPAEEAATETPEVTASESQETPAAESTDAPVEEAAVEEAPAEPSPEAPATQESTGDEKSAAESEASNESAQ